MEIVLGCHTFVILAGLGMGSSVHGQGDTMA